MSSSRKPGSVFRRLLTASFEERMSLLSLAYWRCKTKLLWRPQMQHVGTGTTIMQPMMLSGMRFIRIGDHVQIRNGARIEALQSNPERVPLLTIGDRVNIEQDVHIICHSRVAIGSDVSITGRCSIVDVTHPFDDVLSPVKVGARIKDENSFVVIGDGSFIGIGTVILPNVRIGRQCVIGANSVVSRSIPDFTVAAGAPAVPLKRYDPAQNRWISVEKLAPETTVVA